MNGLAQVPDEELSQLKYTYFCSAIGVYNLYMESMRSDPTLTLTAMLSSFIKADFDKYTTTPTTH